jgi:monofunctional biosynthetic peptidoglycan transglycosylase
VALAALQFIDPPTTAVQMQRQAEALFRRNAYEKRYEYVPLSRTSPEVQHAVIAAEDGRF